MNAAARMIHQSNFFSGHFADIRLSKQFYFHIGLLIAVLASALSVVYVTNMHRLSLSQLQIQEQKSHQLELRWGQLLLEQASLSTPARVQHLAADKLKMMVPSDKQTYILRAK